MCRCISTNQTLVLSFSVTLVAVLYTIVIQIGNFLSFRSETGKGAEAVVRENRAGVSLRSQAGTEARTEGELRRGEKGRAGEKKALGLLIEDVAKIYFLPSQVPSLDDLFAMTMFGQPNGR